MTFRVFGTTGKMRTNTKVNSFSFSIDFYLLLIYNVVTTYAQFGHATGGSCATGHREPCQAGNRAALSGPSCAPQSACSSYDRVERKFFICGANEKSEEVRVKSEELMGSFASKHFKTSRHFYKVNWERGNPPPLPLAMVPLPIR